MLTRHSKPFVDKAYVTGPAKISHVSAKKSPTFFNFVLLLLIICLYELNKINDTDAKFNGESYEVYRKALLIS